MFNKYFSVIFLQAVLIVLLFAGTVLQNNTYAKQTLEKQRQENITSFKYGFKTKKGQHHTLSFALKNKLLAESANRFTRTRRLALSANAREKLQEISDRATSRFKNELKNEFRSYLKKQSEMLPEGISITVNDNNADWSISSDGQLPEYKSQRIFSRIKSKAAKKWRKLAKANQQKFDRERVNVAYKEIPRLYKQQFYSVKFEKNDSINLQLSVRVDFIQVIKHDTDKLRPVSDAIALQTQGMSKREIIAYTLHFLQSIPYNRLKTRDGKGLLGFVAPLTLFDLNKGDCDTKSTALAALLRNLIPNLKMQMVLVPGHAFLAIDLPARKSDDTIVINGHRYVVVEPTGPSLSAVGVAHAISRPYLYRKKNQIEYLLSVPTGLQDSL